MISLISFLVIFVIMCLVFIKPEPARIVPMSKSPKTDKYRMDKEIREEVEPIIDNTEHFSDITEF